MICTSKSIDHNAFHRLPLVPSLRVCLPFFCHANFISEWQLLNIHVLRASCIHPRLRIPEQSLQGLRNYKRRIQTHQEEESKMHLAQDSLLWVTGLIRWNNFLQTMLLHCLL